MWIFFWGHYKIVLFWGLISIHFSIFKAKVQNGNILGVAKISNKFWGMPDIPDIFFFFFFFFFFGGGGVGRDKQ